MFVAFLWRSLELQNFSWEKVHFESIFRRIILPFKFKVFPERYLPYWSIDKHPKRIVSSVSRALWPNAKGQSKYYCHRREGIFEVKSSHSVIHNSFIWPLSTDVKRQNGFDLHGNFLPLHCSPNSKNIVFYLSKRKLRYISPLCLGHPLMVPKALKLPI